MTEKIMILKESLIKSQWPKCNVLADELLSIGTEEAKNALVDALKAKRHHIRTASIKALAGFKDKSVVKIIENHLSDSAYETRIEAKNAIKLLTGVDVKTSTGE